MSSENEIKTNKHSGVVINVLILIIILLTNGQKI